jgi:hypothetical protein
MKVYSFSEARQQLATLLKQARRDGQVRIRRRDGQEFIVQPAPPSTGSPLDVPGLNLELTIGDIVELVRESRRSTDRFLRPARVNDRELTPRPSKRKGRSSK